MYKGLSRAQLSFDYLHTNSTTHEFLFGALAELLDNARDAYATKINIHSVSDPTLRGGYMLCFLDDGQGMSPEEASDIITFGKSTKKSLDSHMIGKYGNGLKSGSMRIGNDLMLFTKKDSSLTCVFLSRTFHEREQLEEIIVPMPSFDANSKRPLAKTPREREKHVQEMELILKYSPFRTDAQFMKEFDKIEGASGTLVIVYNLKLLDTGEPELDVKTDPYDILLSSPDDDGGNEGLLPERKSFRSYASILYVDPHMRVYIQGKKVRTKRIVSNLFKPRSYRYTSARFKARSEKETKKAEGDARNAEFRAREAESKAKDLEIKLGMMPDKDQRIELRRAQTQALELRKEAQLRKAISERKNKSLKEPKQLVFVFGINLENRSRDGVFVYNCSRLIKMYQKIGPQLDGGVLCNGVVGVVDAPYLVLEPTHNKQDFADAKEYRHLQQAMGEHMLQYWRDIDIAQQGVSKFWENFGYISPNWHALPSSDPKYIRKRTAQVQITLQCDLCLKWRIIPYSSNNINKVFPDDWVCSMNPDPAHNRCSAPEEKPNLPEGILKKVPKSKEQKEKDLEEEIKRKQSLLDKMQHKPAPKRRVDSSPSSMSSLYSEDVDDGSHGGDVRSNKMKCNPHTHSFENESSHTSRKQHATHDSERTPTKGIPHRPSHHSSSSRSSSHMSPKNFSASMSSVSPSPYKPSKLDQTNKLSHQSPIKQPTKRPSYVITPTKNSSTPSPLPRSYKIPRHDKKVRTSIDRSSNHSKANSDDDDYNGRRTNSFVRDEDDDDDGDDDDDDDDRYSDRMSEKRKKLAIPPVTYEKKNSKLKEKLIEVRSRNLHIRDKVRHGSSGKISSENTRTVSPITTTSGKDDDEDNDDDDDYNSIADTEGNDDRVSRIKLKVGCKVKAMVQKFWIDGEVVEESSSKETCKVQFDSSFHGITDMWFPKDSHDIQVMDDKVGEHNNTDNSIEVEESIPADISSTNDTSLDTSLAAPGPEDEPPEKNGLDDDHDDPPLDEAPVNGSLDVLESFLELPSTSANKSYEHVGTNTTFNLQAYEEIANGFRTCLRYFLPPQWYMDKDAVSSLATQDLSSFPLDDFFDQYEKGLRKLVSSFQNEAQVKQCEAEQASHKLSTIRRMIAKLLKTINEDFEIDSECDTDDVDDLLALCLRQALEHARGTSEPSN